MCGRTTTQILAVIQTNTALTLHGGDTLFQRDKLIYSGFSKSGYDLWNVGKALGEHLKAIVAIQPQNLNMIQNDYRPKKQVDGGNAADGRRAPSGVGAPPSIGKDVIPDAAQAGRRGLHHRAPPPAVPPRSWATRLLRLLPQAPAAVFAYPPRTRGRTTS